MLRKVRLRNHVMVGLAIALMALLAGCRVIGGGDDSLVRPERFDAKQVTVWPEGDNGVHVREVVDIDFGPTERHGYQRIIPNDFGEPQSVEATSDVNSDVTVVNVGNDTRIRIGDPNETITGRHRYTLDYVLPDARLDSGVLALDIIGNDETMETGRFEVVVTGFEFGTTACDTGAFGVLGGCDLVKDDSGNYVAVIEPLAPGDLITVGGTITGFDEPSLPPIPDPQEPVPGGFSPLGLVMIPVGVLGGALAFLWNRRRGSNEVAGAGGAADAAFGGLPTPGTSAATLAGAPTRRVTDAQLAAMATIEFVPPRGLEPWMGQVLLREFVDQDTVVAWFSEMIAREALVITTDDDQHTLEPGPQRDRVSAADQMHVAQLFRKESSIELGTYDATFAGTWRRVLEEQQDFIRDSGWWSSTAGRSSSIAVGFLGAVLVIAVLVAVNVINFATQGLELLTSPWLAIVLGIALPFFVGLLAYAAMVPSRTATGSALALRTESFRRFLASSEGKHVQWAWDNGLLREYSAWAVALDAADAWERAIRSSDIPEPQAALGGPLLVHSLAYSMASTSTQPSSSGGSSGGFSGGGGGGGGGGGSSGSW
ncbi:MAG TPA: DUF2207 domain-containing protein, partial [Jiangellaceae bacterium]|nr:DUF2207 domain-containing protein [Jiangellaceae bacterium]